MDRSGLAGIALPRHRMISRRSLVGIGLFAGAVGLSACASPAAPTAAPAAAPAAAPTVAPPKPASGTPPPATPAPTQAPAKPQQVVPLRVGIIANLFDNAFSFIGQEKGIFRKNGVDVEFVNFQEAVSMTKAMLAGECLTGEMGTTAVFMAVEGGAALKIVAATKPKLNFIVASRKEIGSLADLYGKSIGSGGVGSALHFVMLALLEMNKLDPDKVNFVNSGPAPETFKALSVGKVDASALTVDLVFTTLEQPDLKVLVEDVGAMLPNYLRFVLPVRDQDLQAQRGTILNLLKGYAETFRYVPTHRDEVIRIAVERLGKKQQDAEQSFDLYLKRRFFDPNLRFTREQVQYMQELNIKVKQQQAVLPFERIGTFELLDQVHKELGLYTFPE